ncbi:histidinol dehydrogenase [Chloroflexota bacterium]
MKTIRDFKKAKEVLSRRGPLPDMLETDDREQSVRQIIDEVGRRGDTALLEYTQQFDGVKLSSLEVSREDINTARKKIDTGLLSALELAAERIQAYHQVQKENLFKESAEEGVGWLVKPLERVGVHTPGFSAPLPSSLLMTAIPAKVAGVKEVIVTAPPGKDGVVSQVTLAAAGIAGIDRIFSVGGAQAVAAMAYGTQTIPAVDKVCGPGNIFVLLAKKLLYGTVGIDGLYGPSEVLIIADDTANPAYCAADLLAQAEHSLASAIMVTTSPALAEKVIGEVEKQLKELSRPVLAKESLEERGLIVVVESITQAVELANLYAPEHLLLMMKGADSYIESIKNAGCIVTGEKATVVLGDYVAGPSHTLPTGGTARFSSPLNVSDFIKLTSVIDVDKVGIEKIGKAAQVIAEAEGLEAHARAVGKRLNTG